MAEYLQAKLGDLEDLVVMPLPDWGHVSRTAEETDNPYADVQTQVRLRTSALRHPSFKVKLEASTKDELISAENELRAERAKPIEDHLLPCEERGQRGLLRYGLVRKLASSVTPWAMAMSVQRPSASVHPMSRSATGTSG